MTAKDIWDAKTYLQFEDERLRPALDLIARIPHEAPKLVLNSGKARTQLGWFDKLSFEESVEWTINWYKNVLAGNDPLEETLKNIRHYESK